MRRFLCGVLVLCLMFTLGAQAAAETQAVKTATLTDVYDLVLNKSSKVLAVQGRSSGLYRLVGTDGNDITGEIYTDVRAQGSFFEISSGNGRGLVDGAGNVLIPEKYVDIVYISPRWYAGVNVVESSADNFDYKSNDWNTNETTFFLITSVDIYYRGQVAGSLGRERWSDYAYAYGDYLYLRDREGIWHYYNKELSESGYSIGSSSEYESDYNGNVTHRGSGQKAFIQGCTLKADEVKQAYFEINGKIVDLQGNILFSTPYSVRKVHNRYVFVQDNNTNKYGVLDMQGNLCVPFDYDRLNSYDDSDTAFEYGIFQAEKNGKIGYVNAQGKETTEFKYSSSVVSAGFLFSSIRDLEGNYIIICGGYGELPETYPEVGSGATSSSRPIITLKNKNGEVGVLDVYGKIVIPFTPKVTDAYNVSMSDDGSVIVVQEGGYSDRTYSVYQVTFDKQMKGIESAATVSEVPDIGNDQDGQEIKAEEPVTEDLTGLENKADDSIEDAQITTAQAETNDAPEQALTQEKPYLVVTTQNSATNLRLETNGDAEVITKIPKGSEVQVIGSVIAASGKPWYIVQYNDQKGYVYFDNIKLPNEPWACPTCQTSNTGKFCVNCGTSRQCKGCGYTPYGSIPKFCPECGTKFGE